METTHSRESLMIQGIVWYAFYLPRLVGLGRWWVYHPNKRQLRGKEKKQMIELTKCKTCDEQINPAEHEGCNYCDECCHELQMSWQVK